MVAVRTSAKATTEIHRRGFSTGPTKVPLTPSLSSKISPHPIFMGPLAWVPHIQQRLPDLLPIRSGLLSCRTTPPSYSDSGRAENDSLKTLCGAARVSHPLPSRNSSRAFVPPDLGPRARCASSSEYLLLGIADCGALALPGAFRRPADSGRPWRTRQFTGPRDTPPVYRRCWSGHPTWTQATPKSLALPIDRLR